jgi:uncharacterized protein YcfL
MRKRTWTALVIASFFIASCSSDPGITGRNGEWIKGKALSLKATFENVGVSWELRNDSDKDIAIDPIKLVFWGKSKGKQEASFSAGVGGQSATLKPKESLSLPPMGDTGDLDKVSIYLGRDGAPEREVFTVKWR